MIPPCGSVCHPCCDGGCDVTELHLGPTLTNKTELRSRVDRRCALLLRGTPGATDKANYPVPGTTVLVPVEKADRWAKARPDVSFAGYLVTARCVTDLPVQLLAVDEGAGGRVPDACQIERSTTVTGGSLRRPQLVTAAPVRSGGELR
ncbi:DUF6578 domain-containing protein [Streptomyces sp. NPDC005969]|uniref:DUF6578 domain-containing protein n=1 Tax=Streptomyces sp. NPDC005969 TaxID=3156722 RepID=UPI0033FBEBD0